VRVVWPGSSVSVIDDPVENACAQARGPDAIADLGRMRGLPDAQIGALTGGDGTTVGKAEGAGGMDGGALQRLKRGHAEQGAGHVHGKRQAGHGR
jgi:hypothetical protein